EAARDRHNEVDIYDPRTKERIAPSFRVDFEAPEGDIGAQRVDLSRRAEHGELDGFVDIGPDVFELVPVGSVADERHEVRYASDKLAARDFPRWAEGATNDGIQAKRLSAEPVSIETVRRTQPPAAFHATGLTRRDPRTGGVGEPSDASRRATF